MFASRVSFSKVFYVMAMCGLHSLTGDNIYRYI